MKLTKKDCWVVAAAYNERRHIEDVVRKVRAQGYKIVVVDDGSNDKTEELARNAGAVVLRHVLNLGKGAAMKTGADYVVREGAKAIIFVDGDGQHKPEELPSFFTELNKGRDIVFGARRMRKSMPFERRLGNWALRAVVNKVYNIKIHDPLAGYRAVTARAYKKIRWQSSDYSVETEMIARAGKEILKYSEVEITTIYHSRHKGMTIFDGIRVMIRLVWWRMTH